MKVQKFNAENHPIHVQYMFNGGNSTGYKILYLLSSTHELFKIRAIAYMINSSIGGTSQELKKLVEQNYLIIQNGKYKLNTANVQDCEQNVQDCEQNVQDCEKETIYIINKKNIKKNISISKKTKLSCFDINESISKENYQKILTDKKLANNDRDWLYRQVQTMQDHFDGKKKKNWTATLRNWVRKARYQFGDEPNKINTHKMTDGERLEHNINKINQNFEPISREDKDFMEEVELLCK